MLLRWGQTNTCFLVILFSFCKLFINVSMTSIFRCWIWFRSLANCSFVPNGCDSTAGSQISCCFNGHCVNCCVIRSKVVSGLDIHCFFTEKNLNGTLGNYLIVETCPVCWSSQNLRSLTEILVFFTTMLKVYLSLSLSLFSFFHGTAYQSSDVRCQVPLFSFGPCNFTCMSAP